jgi:alkylation response protein AidB-like acyl-CoA dehydrogenase
MDVRLSPEQVALRDSVAHVVDRLGPQAVGELDDRERAGKLDAAVVSSGWRELRTAADDGAPWATGVEVALVAEELGRGLADAAYLGPTLAAELRRLAGAPPASAAETVALTADMTTLACLPGATAGTTVAVDADSAAAALALAPAPGGHTLVQVALAAAKGAAGGAATSSDPVDLTRRSVAIDPSAAVTPVSDQTRVLPEEDETRWTALGLALTTADLVGAMRGAVDLAVGYATERRQYGTAIGSFQAVQHLLADAFVAVEGSRSAALHAAWAVDALSADDALAAGAVAKAYAARAARTVCETAIQVHGGIGNTWECLAHVYLRRVLLAADVLGGAGANLARVLDRHQIGGARGLR